MSTLNVTIWNEFVHEQTHDEVKKIYPDGIHKAIAAGIKDMGDFSFRFATLEEPQHGLSDEVLDATDVLVWWGHMAHDKVDDEVVDRVQQRVLSGMGLVALHSAHHAKIFKRLMGTNCSLSWREADEKERLWVIEPAHPIMKGIPASFELSEEEMYGERFDIPTPDKVLMVSWFQGGEVFRSACTWQRGHGRVFYFRPGHESHPTYKNEHVLRVIANACTWARRRVDIDTKPAPNILNPAESVPNAGKEHVG